MQEKKSNAREDGKFSFMNLRTADSCCFTDSGSDLRESAVNGGFLWQKTFPGGEAES